MPIKTFRPTTPSRRYITSVSRDDITKQTPEKSLVESKKRSGGRNSTGRVTSRFIGGGHKQAYRVIDFKRDKAGIPAVVTTIEYDPNRSARIALLAYADGEKRYILQPEGLKVGQKVVSGPEADILVGNALPLRNIPPGTSIHNLELKPGKGAQMVRSAGGRAPMIVKKYRYHLRGMASRPRPRSSHACLSTIDAEGDLDHENITIGQAGRM